MQPKEFNHTEATAYLLGQLSEADAARLEAVWLADETKFAQLQAMQDEMLDAYAGGQLTPPEREQFERQILASPFLRERAAFAQTLAQHIHQQNTDVTTAVGAEFPRASQFGGGWLWEWFYGFRLNWQWTAAAVGLLLVLGGGWWLMRSQPTSPTQAQLTPVTTPVTPAVQASPATTPEPKTIPQLPKPKTESLAPQTLASIVLTPLALRDKSNLPRLRIPTAARTVRFQLRLANANPRQQYRIEIENSDETRVWSRDRQRARAATAPTQFTIEVPVRLLTADDYLIKLQRRTTAGTYEEVATYPVRIQLPER